MSRVVPAIVDCAACGAACQMQVFASLNGDRLPGQVDAIVDGTFELATCGGCGREYQPEHQMLFVKFYARLWIVMFPLAARTDFASLERSLGVVLSRSLSEAPASLTRGLRELRPQLVFGQHALAEAVRCWRDAIDPSLLECVKLLCYRSNLRELMTFGPCELSYERTGATGELILGVRCLASGRRVGETCVSGQVLGDAQRVLTEFSHTHPELFERPFVSMLRYFTLWAHEGRALAVG